MHSEQRRGPSVPKIQPVKFIERSNGTIKGYAVNTFHGLVKNYNQDRVSIIMNITKPNYKGRWPRCSYFGVFDGHGGNKCSDFLKENMHKYITQNSHFPQQPIEALKFGFKKAQQQFLAYAQHQNPVERSGSCAIVILIIDEMCYIANVGDSRAILSANSGKNVYAISKDHKPDSDSERERVYNAGGKIYQSSVKNKHGNTVVGPFRIDPGKLSVSRSFGDIEAKLPKYDGNPKVLIAKPQITYFEINSQEHDFVMLCSDGVYDKLQNEDVSQCFWDTKDRIDEKEKYQFIGRVPSRVIQKSMQKLSMDNLTSLVVVFQDHGKLMLPPQKILKPVEKQVVRRPYSSNNQNQNQNNRKVLKVKENTPKKQPKTVTISSRGQETGHIWDNQENHKENKDTNRQDKNHYRQNYEQFRKNNLDPLEKMAKRKSSSNLLSNVMQKRLENNLHNPHSLNNSVSAKMLAGTKAYHRKSKQVGLDKVNINDLLHKKKSVDHIKKQKETIWKPMMTHKAGSTREKLIRF